jgi:hypothetical protein
MWVALVAVTTAFRALPFLRNYAIPDFRVTRFVLECDEVPGDDEDDHDGFLNQEFFQGHLLSFAQQESCQPDENGQEEKSQEDHDPPPFLYVVRVQCRPLQV